MQKKIQSALISVFYKDGLETIVRQLHELGVSIYSTGGTRKFIEDQGIPCIPVEDVTAYPSILGGRVKTLHPKIFGGILGRRANETDLAEMKEYEIPEIDLVIVDLYPFEETLAQTTEEASIIEKIDIGGPSMIRAAAKNFSDLLVVAAKTEYSALSNLLKEHGGSSSIEQRKSFAARAFEIVAHYDVAIAKYFNSGNETYFLTSVSKPHVLRYGENPHQSAVFYGDLEGIFDQLNGKQLSYNNLVDVEAAVQLIREFNETTFAVIKHTNVCGIASRETVKQAWDDGLAGDPESAFGGVLVTNGTIDAATASAIQEIFFEVLIAPAFEPEAVTILSQKKNRILLQYKQSLQQSFQYKSLLNGTLVQQIDQGDHEKWEEVGGRTATSSETADLEFANLVCKHLKSNAIALVKNKQLIGKGCGQTSRVDAVRQAIEKARQFEVSTEGAVMASDAFFPFDDCVRLGHDVGIKAFVQPGGSIRDKDSIAYCKEHNLVMVMTGLRHFNH